MMYLEDYLITHNLLSIIFVYNFLASRKTIFCPISFLFPPLDTDVFAREAYITRSRESTFLRRG